VRVPSIARALPVGLACIASVSCTLVVDSSGLSTADGEEGGATLPPREDGGGAVTEGGTEGGLPVGCTDCDAAGTGPGRGRVTDGLVALYEFEENAGAVVHDAVAPALDMTVADADRVSWVRGALLVNGATVLRSMSNATTKLVTSCVTRDEISVEAWVRPTNVTQTGPARIVTLSPNIGARNFTLAQSGHARRDRDESLRWRRPRALTAAEAYASGCDREGVAYDEESCASPFQVGAFHAAGERRARRRV